MKPDFKKMNGIVPAIIQDADTLSVLMLGFMNEEAYQKTLAQNKVCFYSRTRKQLWTKGETSGNFLEVKSISLDCDEDTLLIKVNAPGPVCHTGKKNCFGTGEEPVNFLYELERTIHKRIDENTTGSYTNELYKKGINKMAQKLGEEAVELVIESKDSNEELFLGEAADLLFHFLLLCKGKNIQLQQVEAVLQQRMHK